MATTPKSPAQRDKKPSKAVIPAKNTTPKGKAGNPSASSKSKPTATKGQRACTPELAEEILSHIEKDSVSFSEACRRCECNVGNAWGFIHANRELDIRYARARESRGNAYGEQVAQIGLATLAGKYKPDAARVAADCLKWASGRMAPKQFGDRVSHEHGGSGGGAIPLVVFTPAQLSSLTDAEIETMITLAAKLGLELPGVAMAGDNQTGMPS